MFKFNKIKGFTLVELIIVVAILGILAAIFLPRFTDLQASARKASLKALVGGLKAGNVVAKAAGIDQLGSMQANGTVTMEGKNVVLLYGEPTADALGIGNAVDISGYTASAGGATAGANITFTAENNPVCIATYTAATSATVPSSVTANITACK